MEQEKNKFISVSYRLYDVTAMPKALLEETQDGRPFDFISGFGITLPAFEAAIVNLTKGEHFDFTLSSAEAYGDYVEAHIVDLDKSIFMIDGKFDDTRITIGAVIPLQNEDGQRFNGRVLAISADKVKIDLNHPLAGKTLNFVGEVLENRDATAEELAQFAKMLHGEHSCGGCGGAIVAVVGTTNTAKDAIVAAVGTTNAAAVVTVAIKKTIWCLRYAK